MFTLGFSLFDFIDYTIFLLLLILDMFLLKRKLIPHAILFILVVLLGGVLPIWSIGREITQNTIENGKSVDSFELIYSFSKVSVYWLMLVLQFIYISILGKKKGYVG